MSAPILSARGLTRNFGSRTAVDAVDLDINEGETLAVVGESGSGKTTLARLLLFLDHPTAGSIHYRGTPIRTLTRTQRRPYRRDIQAVFQDPAASLNPRMRVENILAQVILEHDLATTATVRAVIAEQLEAVGLVPAAQFMPRYPHQLSGGQQQRVAIARDMALKPRLIIADEPLSSLDISVQTQLLNLMTELKQRTQVGFVIISHDLAAVQSIADRVAVMYRGRIVESGNDVLTRPRHPYTQALVDAKLIPNPRLARARRRIILPVDSLAMATDNTGCRFRHRCPFAATICAESAPLLQPAGETGSLVACHFAGADAAFPPPERT